MSTRRKNKNTGEQKMIQFNTIFECVYCNKCFYSEKEVIEHLEKEHSIKIKAYSKK